MKKSKDTNSICCYGNKSIKWCQSVENEWRKRFLSLHWNACGKGKSILGEAAEDGVIWTWRKTWPDGGKMAVKTFSAWQTLPWAATSMYEDSECCAWSIRSDRSAGDCFTGISHVLVTSLRWLPVTGTFRSMLQILCKTRHSGPDTLALFQDDQSGALLRNFICWFPG